MVTRDAIVDAALELADAGNWERLRLHEVADRLGCTLGDIHEHFREKEEIVDAWLDRADQAMLAVPGEADVRTLVLAWLDALAPYRRVTREMVAVRLEPGHLHHQIPSLLRISRTVQWMREAAERDHGFIARALDETACTALCITVFTHWLFDSSPGQQATRKRLDALLETSTRLRAALGLPAGR
jgi:ubiquinone biosynthesis protein COQ9